MLRDSGDCRWAHLYQDAQRALLLWEARLTICSDRLEVAKAGSFIQVYPHVHLLVEDADNIDNSRFDGIEDQMPSCVEAPIAWTEFRATMANSRILFQG